jgi:hypothetical protein
MIARELSVVVDAVYYVVRVLGNAKRGFVKPEVSSEAPPEARALAEQAIREIESTEGTEIAKLNQARLDGYLSSLQRFLVDRTPETPTLTEDARSYLEAMRSGRETTGPKRTSTPRRKTR